VNSLKEVSDRELINELIARKKVIIKRNQKTGKIRTYLIRDSKLKPSETTKEPNKENE
jgi:hypothetical protein